MADHQNPPITALATPWGSSAIAVIRCSGLGAIELVDRIFLPAGKLASAAANSVHHGFLVDPDSRVRLDEVMVVLLRAPGSYTGEDTVEVMCHGSTAGIQRILALLLAIGFRQAEPGEFTLRAFMAGKLDLTRAEAVNEIVSARTAESHEMALQRLSGALEQRINAIKARLVTLLAAVDIQLDYPEEDSGEVVIAPEAVVEVRDKIRELLASYRTGRIYQQGVRVAIAGRTNAGKSSLFNELLRQDRSIVSETAGTTRDYIESTIALAGVPVRLYDTAGFRDSSERVETEGMRRSREILDAADLVLYVIDAGEGVHDSEPAMLQQLRESGRLVGVWNKIDLPAAGAHAAPHGFAAVSLNTGQGLPQLIELICERILPASLTWNGEPVIDSLRQKQLLEAADSALGHVLEGLAMQIPVDAVALDVEEALHSLGAITGEVTTEDVLSAMFAGFCVGK